MNIFQDYIKDNIEEADISSLQNEERLNNMISHSTFSNKAESGHFWTSFKSSIIEDKFSIISDAKSSYSIIDLSEQEYDRLGVPEDDFLSSSESSNLNWEENSHIHGNEVDPSISFEDIGKSSWQNLSSPENNDEDLKESKQSIISLSNSNMTELREAESIEEGCSVVNNLQKLYNNEELEDNDFRINKLIEQTKTKIKLTHNLFFNPKKEIFQSIEDDEEFQKEYLHLFDAEIEEELEEILKVQFTKEHPDKLKEIIYDKELIIDFRNYGDYKFLKDLKYRIKLNKVIFDNVPKSDQHLKDYLLNYFPECWDSFKLKFAKEAKKDGIDFYFDELKVISLRIKEDLNLWHCKLNQDQIVSLFEKWKDIKKIEFNWCEFDLESVPNLGDSLKYSKIKTFKLWYWGDWRFYKYQFKNLVQGLCQTKHFFQNLKSLFIWGNRISKQEVLQILKS